MALQMCRAFLFAKQFSVVTAINEVKFPSLVIWPQNMQQVAQNFHCINLLNKGHLNPCLAHGQN
jgi:hypothetical protein